jgi:hypothetical protein
MTQLTARPRDAGSLIPAWLVYLTQEEGFLTTTLESMKRVRAALIQNDLPGLTEALAGQDRAVQTGLDLRQGRGLLQEETAAALGIPAEELTLGRLAARSSGLPGERLALARDRLSQLARELDRTNRDNAIVVRFNLDFYEQMLVAITGGEPGGGGYGPQGNKRAAPCGSLIEARG